MADYGKLPYKVADISLADFGRKELNLAEVRFFPRDTAHVSSTRALRRS
jgi:S-adenosylhomocysteine hydrolase